MTEDQFDRCPSCNSVGTYGIRCHPKFSLKVIMYEGDFLDMVPLYAHSEEAIKTLATMFDPANVVSVEGWDGEKWVELL